jgi:N-acetylmuramoyl-L-alanine amidase
MTPLGADEVFVSAPTVEVSPGRPPGEEERSGGMRPLGDDASGLGRLRRAGAVRCVVATLLILLGASEAAATVQVVRLRSSTTPARTRVVIDLSAPAAYRVRRLGNPERIAVDIPDAVFRRTNVLALGGPLVERVRRNALSSGAQVVLDLASAASFNHFALPANAPRPPRIVIDVMPLPAGSRPLAKGSSQRDRPVDVSVEHAGSSGQAAPARQTEQTEDAYPFIVVLDPGHGGLDPGAVREGVREKDVVLRVARAAAAMLDGLPGYRAILTRDGDRTLSLGSRVRMAQQARGDLFISIHCNTHPRAVTSGMEVYFLSLQGASDREARELANKENAADLVGLAGGLEEDDSVLAILMDLQMTHVLSHSSRLAEQMLAACRSSRVIESRRIKQARFQVLSNLAMPSILVEVAYLSNRKDRKLLASSEGAVALARVLVTGILAYRRDQPALAAFGAPEAWTREYSVKRGDSLWKLAHRHGTTVERILEENNLPSSRLLVGQTLRLPGVN